MAVSFKGKEAAVGSADFCWIEVSSVQQGGGWLLAGEV